MAAYRGKRVLVTGADGFIGSHLVEALVGEGAEVTALALYNAFGTAGWLDGLVRWARADRPSVGLVGPVTNYAGGRQQVEPGYAELEGLDHFAAARREALGERAAEADRLTGFCLLVRRVVFEAIGGLDERFGLGFGYLDDYRKAVEAVTPADVQAAARKYLNPAKVVLVAAGPIDQKGKPVAGE